jgi:hypothetical protein
VVAQVGVVWDAICHPSCQVRAMLELVVGISRLSAKSVFRPGMDSLFVPDMFRGVYPSLSVSRRSLL